LTRHGVDDRDRTGARTLAWCGATSTPHPHGAFGQIRTGGLPRTGGTLYRWSYEGMKRAGRPGLEPGISRVKAERVCLIPLPPTGAPGRIRTGNLRLTGPLRFQLRHGGVVPSARLERAPTQALDLGPLPFGLRGRGASDWPRTSCLRFTRATLCRMSYRGMGWGRRSRTSTSVTVS
jgi:hypothetical protein